MGFYGRTCSSAPKRLTPNGIMFDENDEDFITFHTNFDRDMNQSLIVEVVVSRGKGTAQEESVSAGFAICDIFEFAKGKQTTLVTTGTPRLFSFGAQGIDSTQQKRIGKTTLTFEIRQCT